MPGEHDGPAQPAPGAGPNRYQPRTRGVGRQLHLTVGRDADRRTDLHVDRAHTGHRTRTGARRLGLSARPGRAVAAVGDGPGLGPDRAAARAGATTAGAAAEAALVAAGARGRAR